LTSRKKTRRATGSSWRIQKKAKEGMECALLHESFEIYPLRLQESCYREGTKAGGMYTLEKGPGKLWHRTRQMTKRREGVRKTPAMEGNKESRKDLRKKKPVKSEKVSE